eukprot:jgi/Mesen1/539/ME001041S10741
MSSRAALQLRQSATFIQKNLGFLCADQLEHATNHFSAWSQVVDNEQLPQNDQASVVDNLHKHQYRPQQGTVGNSAAETCFSGRTLCKRQATSWYRENLWKQGFSTSTAEGAGPGGEEDSGPLSSQSEDELLEERVILLEDQLAAEEEEEGEDDGSVLPASNHDREADPPKVWGLELVEKVLENVRASNVEVLHVGDRCAWTDTMVLATGRSARHIRGIADALVYEFKRSERAEQTESLPTVEGRSSEHWMVVDFGELSYTCQNATHHHYLPP